MSQVDFLYPPPKPGTAMTLDASETFAFEWAKQNGFSPEKRGPNDYFAISSVDRDMTVSATTPGQFVREVAATVARIRKGGK